MNRSAYLKKVVPEDETLTAIATSIESSGLPLISVEREIGQLITILTASIQAKQALEIGTLGGYSGTCIARGLPSDGKLTTLELKEEHAALARQNFDLAGFANQVDVVVGEAMRSLKNLQAANKRFDFIFIDADKPNYPNYLQLALELSHLGTLIVADNVFLSDRVTDVQNKSPGPTAMREYNKALFSSVRLQSTILPLYDGIAISRVIR